MNEIVNCAAYHSGRRVADVELDRVHEVLKEGKQFVWIGLHEPSEELLARVQEEFDLHDLAVEDAHRAHQRPKMELYGDTVQGRQLLLRVVAIGGDAPNFRYRCFVKAACIIDKTGRCL